MVLPGIFVNQGDTIGLVGNTGNAIRTPPHLHFGIYRQGSLDPLNYIRQIEALTEASAIDTNLTRQAHCVTSPMLNLRAAPGTKGKIISKLESNSYVKVVGRSLHWYRVLLPDGIQGYVHKDYVKPLSQGYEVVVAGTTYLLADPFPHAVPVQQLPDSSRLMSLARFGNFHFVKANNDLTGWIEIL